jgi:hypothetical protein
MSEGRSGRKEPPASPGPAICARCDKRLEYCCFCDRPDCREAVCYPCLAVDLKESMAVLHDHGG